MTLRGPVRLASVVAVAGLAGVGLAAEAGSAHAPIQSSAVRDLAAGALVGGGASPAATDTGGYPYWNMPCEHYPYATTGPANYCANYDWGPKHTAAYNDPSEISPYGYAYRNCTDYVAWKLATLGVPASIYKGHGNGSGWASVTGLVTNTTPAVGAVAVQTSGTFGHVAFITGVSGSTITISEYNYGENGTYDTRTGTLAGLGFNKVTHFEKYESGAGGAPTVSPPPSITTTFLPAARIATSYSAALSASGGAAPYTWSQSAENLPPGLVLSAGGTVSGTPGQAGTFSFSVTVTGANGASSTSALTMSVGPQYENTAVLGADNSLDFYYNAYGTPTWSPSVVAGARTTYSAPSIAIMANGETVIAAEGANNSLDFYYNTYGTPTWTQSVVADTGSTYSAPSIAVMANGATVISALGPNDSLDFYYNAYGTPTWSPSVVAGAGTTYSAPSIATLTTNASVITAEGAGNSLDFYYNAYGTPTWSPSVVAGQDSTFSAGSVAVPPSA